MLSKKLISFVTVCSANCLVMEGMPAHADVCSALRPHLDYIEQASGTPPAPGLSLQLGEDRCKVEESGDIFENRVECSWHSTSDRSWSRDDALDIGQTLHQSCPFLTSHFGDARHPDADYFLWYGDYTGVTLKTTDKGISLIIQVDEEAFYFS